MKKPLIILNPAARSERAARLQDRLAAMAPEAEIRITLFQGDAERIAREAAGEGFSRIVAAGGDGTINEVVNGIMASGRPEVELGILPVGTMNVFAVELGIPLNAPEAAWEIIRRGDIRTIDLPACTTKSGSRCFVQLAGAGLDAEVVRRTTRESKKALGPLSYLLSLAHVSGARPPTIRIESAEGSSRSGSFVLLGNGRFYGGPFRFFRDGSPTDGLLDVLVFQNQTPWDLLRYMHAIMTGQQTNLSDVEYFQTASLHLKAGEGEEVPYELDGEMSGFLPGTFALRPGGLPVLAPAPR